MKMLAQLPLTPHTQPCTTSSFCPASVPQEKDNTGYGTKDRQMGSPQPLYRSCCALVSQSSGILDLSGATLLCKSSSLMPAFSKAKGMGEGITMCMDHLCPHWHTLIPTNRASQTRPMQAHHHSNLHLFIHCECLGSDSTSHR